MIRGFGSHEGISKSFFEVKQMTTEVKQLEVLIALEAQAKTRAGTIGDSWCFDCGHRTNDLAPCPCELSESFGCAGRKNLCADCRQGHRKVAAHLTQLFCEKRLRIHRADSRRCRLYRFLRGALETLAENGDVQANTLRFLLGANADPRADEPPVFRKACLEAFRTAQFLAFARLAAELDEQEKNYYIERIAMSGIFNPRF